MPLYTMSSAAFLAPFQEALLVVAKLKRAKKTTANLITAPYLSLPLCNYWLSISGYGLKFCASEMNRISKGLASLRQVVIAMRFLASHLCGFCIMAVSLSMAV